jgi:hypothetical protein
LHGRWAVRCRSYTSAGWCETKAPLQVICEASLYVGLLKYVSVDAARDTWSGLGQSCNKLQSAAAASSAAASVTALPAAYAQQMIGNTSGPTDACGLYERLTSVLVAPQLHIDGSNGCKINVKLTGTPVVYAGGVGDGLGIVCYGS